MSKLVRTDILLNDCNETTEVNARGPWNSDRTPCASDPEPEPATPASDLAQDVFEGFLSGFGHLTVPKPQVLRETLKL